MKEGTWFILNAEHDGRAVVASGRGGGTANDEKAGGVGGDVLDGLIDGLEAVDFGGHLARDGGGLGFGGGEFGGAGRAGDLDEIDARQMMAEPVSALSEDLGVGVDLANF